MSDTTPLKEKNFSKISTPYKRNLNINNLKSDSESKNKLFYESSYLIKEIQKKNKLLLSSIRQNKNKLNIKNSFASNRNKHIKKLFIISKESKTIKEEELLQKIDMPNKANNINNSISLSSLINLPKVRFRNRINMKEKLIKNNINRRIKLISKKEPEKNNNPKSKKAFSLKKYMKEYFYSDIQNKFDEKIKTKYFRNDSAIKNEIITMKKIGAFWSKFFQYCAPIIRLQKIHLMKRNIQSKFDKNIKRANSMININKIKN